MYRLLFLTFVLGALCPVASSHTFYEDEAEHAEHLRQARNKLQSHFDEWLSRKLRARSAALRPDPQPAALSDWLPNQDAPAASQPRSRDADASQPHTRGLYASQARSAVQGIPSFKDISQPSGHGFFHLFHLHPPNGDQDSWNHNDDREFSYLLDDKPSWACPQPPCLPPVNPVVAPPPAELPKPVYQYPSLPAYNPYQQDFYPDPTYSQQQPQPSYQYPPSYQPYNPHDGYHQLNPPRDPQPAAYPYQQYYPVYQYPATQPPVHQYPLYQYNQHHHGYPAPGPQKPVQIVNKPVSNIPQLVVPPTPNSTTTQLPYFTTSESTTASTIEETVTEGDLFTLTVTPSIESYDAMADVLEVTSSTLSASTSTLVDEMELFGSSSTVLPALLDLRRVVTTQEPITEEEELYHTTTLAYAEDDSSSEDYLVTPTVPHGIESIVSTTETADTHLTILPVEVTSLEYTEKPTQGVSSEVPLFLLEEHAASTVAETYSTTEIPVYTTTVVMSSSLEDTDSLYVGTTEESTDGYSSSTVEVTTKVPVSTTAVELEVTEETGSTYEGTTENSQKTTVSSEYVPSTIEETSDVPVYTTTVKVENEKTVSAYEETTEESHKTTAGIENTYSTVKETTEVPVYTTTVKIATEEAFSQHEETTEENHKTTVGIEDTYSTVEETTQMPVYTTTVKMVTKETDSPSTVGIEDTYSTVEETTQMPVYTTTVKMVTKETDSPSEEATEDGSKTTVVYANTASAVEETTEVPVHTTTMEMETELPYEGIQKTAISSDYSLTTIEENTEVPVYTTTAKIGTEETISPYERSTEIGEQRSADVSNTALIALPRNHRKGIVRREDALAKRREEQRRSELNMISSEEETGRGHTPPKPETGFEKQFLRRLINMIVRELRQGAVSKEERGRLKAAFGDMWYSIINEAFNYVPVQLPDEDVPRIASRVLEYLLKGTPLARRLETQSVRGRRSTRSRRDLRRPRLEPWQEMLLRAVMARPLTSPDEQKSQEILNAIKDQLQAPEEDLDYSDEDEDYDIRR